MTKEMQNTDKKGEKWSCSSTRLISLKLEHT